MGFLKIMTKPIVFCLFLSSFFLACKKKQINPQDIQIIKTNTNNDLQKIMFLNDSIGYIIGGIRYEEATILETRDGGNTWKLISISGSLENKELYGMCHFENKIYAVGLDGKFFQTKAAETNNWQFTQTSEWTLFRGIDFAIENKGFITYGVAFHSGGILKIDSLGQVLKKDTFDFELDDIRFINPDIGYACGYGAIMKTGDQGENWELLNIQGDYFKSISCPDNQNIWSVGYNGSIVHSADGGKNWEKQRNGNNPLLNRWRLRSVIFRDNKIGYAVGDNGLLIKTEDGGNNWKIMNNEQKEDFLSVFFQGGNLWVVGAKGIILKIIE